MAGRIAVALGVSAAITVFAGVALALRLRWGRLDAFFNTEWGYAILIGFIAAIVASVLGGVGGATSKRLVHLYESDTKGDAATLQKLDNRLVMINRVYALFVLIAVVSMASARFI